MPVCRCSGRSCAGAHTRAPGHVRFCNMRLHVGATYAQTQDQGCFWMYKLRLGAGQGCRKLVQAGQVRSGGARAVAAAAPAARWSRHPRTSRSPNGSLQGQGLGSATREAQRFAATCHMQRVHVAVNSRAAADARNPTLDSRAVGGTRQCRQRMSTASECAPWKKLDLPEPFAPTAGASCAVARRSCNPAFSGRAHAAYSVTISRG